MSLEHEELTEKIIGGAIEVHRRLGPGFLESIYENALVIELNKRGLSVQPQVEVPIRYDGIEVGRHILDLVVEWDNSGRAQGHQKLRRHPFRHCSVIPPRDRPGPWIALELWQAYAGH